MSLNPSVLVACPTAKAKDYAFEDYLEAYRKFDYDNKELYIVDNTDDGGEYARELVRRTTLYNVHHIEPGSHLLDTVDMSWQYILDRAQKLKFDYILSLESDIIAPPNALFLMVDLIRRNDACMVRHSYPLRQGGYICCLGCLIMDANLIKPMWDLSDRLDPKFGTNYHEERRFMHLALESGRPVLDVHNYFQLIHLDDAVTHHAFRVAAGTGHGYETPKRHVTRIKLDGFDGTES